MTQVIDKEAIGRAIGRIPSGTFIITAGQGEAALGMLASWVQQVSFEPPMLAMVLHPERALYALAQETKRVTINVMSTDNKGLMKPFSHPGPDQFAGLETEATDYGVVLNACIAALDCAVTQIVPAGDHHLFLLQVDQARLLNPDAPPFVHLRNSGFHY